MIQKLGDQKNFGILLASMNRSGSTFTANKIAQKLNINLVNIIRDMDPYGVREEEIDIPKLKKAFEENPNLGFIAKQHLVFSTLILRLIKRKYLVPLVLTRNLPDVIVSISEQYSVPNLKTYLTLFPKTFDTFDIERKCDYIIHFIMPELLKFFSSWTRHHEFSKIWFRFEDFKDNNQVYFNKITSLLGIEKIIMDTPEPSPYRNYDSNKVLTDDIIFKIRLNRGVTGRGLKIMNAAQIELIKKMIEQYPIPLEYRNYLLTGDF
jgi:hypothetical protein